jgi:acetyl esterase/lipase
VKTGFFVRLIPDGIIAMQTPNKMITFCKNQAACLLLATAITFIPAGSGRAQPEGQRLSIWPDVAPVGDGTTEKVEVPITVHRAPAEKANGAAMVICPGGGYGMLVKDGEGHGIAKWLNEHGITGIVLEYRLPKGRPNVPLLDAQRALRTVRAHASEWGIRPDRVGIIGFSAGGHLASTAVTHFDAGNPESDDPVERMSSRPDFGILIYPVISLGELAHGGSRTNLLGPAPKPELIRFFSNETQVTAKTPPVFLAHAMDDTIVAPANSRQFHEALLKHKVPAKFLELPSGGHGLNGYKGPMWDAWQKQSLEWLKELKLTTP